MMRGDENVARMPPVGTALPDPEGEFPPLRSVDEIPLRSNGRGPVTKKIQDAFFGLFDGSTEDRWGWLEPISSASESSSRIIIRRFPPLARLPGSTCCAASPC